MPASVVLEGQKAIAPGCPGCSDSECEPRFVSGLADPQALAAPQAAWSSFEASVTSHGGAGVALVAAPDPGFVDARQATRRAEAGAA